MSFKLPESLYPVHDKDGDFFVVPNVATGSIRAQRQCGYLSPSSPLSFHTRPFYNQSSGSLSNTL